ncbi:MAG: Nramp family divalent metal transporter [Gemmatimonadota bacterium]
MRHVRRPSRGLGPGAVVAAAFIGPGTVATATLAGARFGVSLLWALAFSVVATIVLQEMAARLGLVTGEGLGEAIRQRFSAPLARLLSVLLVVAAIVLGNAAYQTGNLLGGSLGMEALAGGRGRDWILLLGIVAGFLLWRGSYRLVEGVLVGLVGVMSIVFLATAIVLAPPLPALLRGLGLPTLPVGADAVALGLVGTTVVPYNLFLHAAAVRERWSGADALPAARRDAVLSITLGGVVSMAIVVTSAAAGGEISSAADMARQLEPLLGPWAEAFFAAGLLAAGLSSAITAPLAAAYAAGGALGWRGGMRSPRFRGVWLFVLLTGMAFGTAGLRPVPAILFAQAANGLLLPGVALFLLLAANDGRRMGRWRNGHLLNLLAVAVLVVVTVLGARAILLAFRAS